jgi:integrase/recombinase XerC
MYIEKFLNYIQYERRYSPHTIEAYKTDLRQCTQFLQEQFETNLVATCSSQIRNWLTELIASGIDARSIRRKVASLRAYFKYLEQNRLLDQNPMVKITLPKISKKLPVFISQQNIGYLLDEIEFNDSFEGRRDRLIMELFYCTGIRLSELVQLKICDFDLYNNELRVMGKGKKERIIPVVDNLKHTLLIYLEEKNKVLNRTLNDYLFITSAGKKVYPKLVYRVVNSYLSFATTVKKRSPHVLRHTFATHMLNNGADINAIKELLGHANLSATEVYTHNTVEKIKSIYKQAHPKA